MKLTTIVGARPQFIKAAVVSRAIRKFNDEAGSRPAIVEKIIHTGQHFDENMSHLFFRELQLPSPDINLGVNSVSHGTMTGRMLEKVEHVLVEERPDWVLVYGDTNSTLAGALAAAKLHIPVAHVEAGLRSFNRRMPEEINRVVADHLSTLLFCPTEAAVNNLAKEGISIGVSQVGDVMFDAFLFYKDLAGETPEILTQLGVKPGEYCLATVHREENTDDPVRLASILEGLAKVGAFGKPVLFPVHPRTRKKIASLQRSNSSTDYLRFMDPVGYLDMIALESNALAIFTDSGGVQKEAFFSHVPCITLRNETEWVETVESGWNILTGANPEKIIKAFKSITNLARISPPSYYGDGRTAEKIIKELLQNE